MYKKLNLMAHSFNKDILRIFKTNIKVIKVHTINIRFIDLKTVIWLKKELPAAIL